MKQGTRISKKKKIQKKNSKKKKRLQALKMINGEKKSFRDNKKKPEQMIQKNVRDFKLATGATLPKSQSGRPPRNGVSGEIKTRMEKMETLTS